MSGRNEILKARPDTARGSKAATRCALSLGMAAAILVTPFCWPVDTIDEVLAVVNQNPILQSDLVLAALVGVGPDDDGSDTELNFDPLGARIRLELHYLDLIASGALQRLEIDVSQQLQLMIAYAGGETQLRDALPDHGLEWEDVEALALRVAAVQAWIESHLRPRVTVTVQEVEQAYQRVIAGPMREAGATPPSLARVNEDLRRLVSEEKLNAEIQRWSDQSRERHRVTRFVR